MKSLREISALWYNGYDNGSKNRCHTANVTNRGQG
jgi:hypothetical protein